MLVKRFIQAFEPVDKSTGATVTYSTATSRKSFALPKPNTKNYPIAVESFALDPDYYAELMKKVQEMHSSPNK